jgi:hypothetical protein
VKKQLLLNTVKQYSEVFQNDLPGYNGAFGPCFANFEFASQARPTPQKSQTPEYGSHANLLYNKKCQQMKTKVVVIDPLAHGIQLMMCHNSWIIKKPYKAHLSWDKCEVDDVRVVVGFDPLNKFLIDAPGKVTKPEGIYTSIAN